MTKLSNTAVKSEMKEDGLCASDLGEGVDCFVPIPDGFLLENGEPLSDTHIPVRRFGLDGGPVVIVVGGISSGRQICGAGGWWADIVGPGRAIDLNRYNVLGFDFAPISDAQHVCMSPQIQARLIQIALDALGIQEVHTFVGASYGGMIGLALAAIAPDRLQRLCVISAAHKPAPLAHAWRGVQRRIVAFAIEQGRPDDGLALARQLAMITYRSPAEFAERFQREIGADGCSDLDRYLIARGQAYIDQIEPRRWLSLSEAIDRCAVAPEAVTARTTLVACPTDQLVPIADMRELAARLPNPAGFHNLPSLYGHDAFLKEPEQLGAILKSCLESDAHVSA